MIIVCVPGMADAGAATAVRASIRAVDSRAVVDTHVPSRLVRIESLRPTDELTGAIEAAGFTVLPTERIWPVVSGADVLRLAGRALAGALAFGLVGLIGGCALVLGYLALDSSCRSAAGGCQMDLPDAMVGGAILGGAVGAAIIVATGLWRLYLSWRAAQEMRVAGPSDGPPDGAA